QIDTFDLKPGHPNGGPYKEIATAVPGIKISEHLPKIANHMKDMVLIRSMSTKEGDHGRATHFLRTGYLPQGAVQFPSVGSLLAKELGESDAAIPNCVSIAPYRFFNPAAYDSGFLGSRCSPLIVGETTSAPRNNNVIDLKVQNLELPKDIGREQNDARL